MTTNGDEDTDMIQDWQNDVNQAQNEAQNKLSICRQT